MFTQTRGRRSAGSRAAWREPCPWSSPVYYRITSPSSARPSARSHSRDNSLLFRYLPISLVVYMFDFYNVRLCKVDNISTSTFFFNIHVHVYCTIYFVTCVQYYKLIHVIIKRALCTLIF